MSQTATHRQDHTELTVLFVRSPTVDTEAVCDSEYTRPVDIEPDGAGVELIYDTD